jgi:hypothetical protein
MRDQLPSRLSFNEGTFIKVASHDINPQRPSAISVFKSLFVALLHERPQYLSPPYS